MIASASVLLLLCRRDMAPPPIPRPIDDPVALDPKDMAPNPRKNDLLYRAPLNVALDPMDMALDPMDMALDPRENDLLYRAPLDVAFIFTHARKSQELQRKLAVAATSLLASTTAPLRLHLITDQDGFHIATDIIAKAQDANQLGFRSIKLAYVSPEALAAEIRSSVNVLQEFFTRRKNAYYRDALFFFSVHLHKMFPHLERLILMDIDVKVKGDIAELHSHFERFTADNILGMTLEQSPVYRHVLSQYRRLHPDTTLGSPPGPGAGTGLGSVPATQGGFPGFNSGVVLVAVDRLRRSDVIRSYLNKTVLEERASFYSFEGHLGDQDLYTLVAFDHPDLFYVLPCGWNRQLCTWWRDHGYARVFDQYFNCTGEVKVIHGNCKTPIPDDL